MVSLVLIHPPQPNSIDDQLNPPMGLLYIAGYLRENGFEYVKIVDLAGHTEEEWYDLIPEADIYGCTMYTSSYSVCKKIAHITKARNIMSKFILGGAHPTALPDKTIEEGWMDGVIVGEGEYLCKLLLDVLSERDIKKKFILKSRERLRLDELPTPAFDLVDFSKYSRTINGYRAPAIYTYRGCQFNCSFCYKDMFGTYPRFFPEEHIRQIVGHYKNLHFDHLVVWDSFFTNKRGRWKKIVKIFQEFEFTYRCNGKIGVDTYDDLRMLKDSGCAILNVGLESGSQKIIDLMEKRFSIQQAKEYIAAAKDIGLILRIFLQFGFPGETRSTIEETMEFIDQMDIDQYSCFTHNPFPGSDVYNNPEKYGVTWLSKNWDDYFTVAGEDGIGGMPFETKWLKRDEALDLNHKFVRFLRSRDWKGSKESYHQKLGI